MAHGHVNEMDGAQSDVNSILKLVSVVKTNVKSMEVSMSKDRQETIVKFDFENDNGTVDEWVYDMSYSPPRVKSVTVDIRRRPTTVIKK